MKIQNHFQDPALLSFAELKDRLDQGSKLHTGLYVGEVEKDTDEISGINVNLASRIQAVATADQVVVSEVLKSLAFGSGLTFEELGDYELKGFEGKWKLSAVL